MPLLYCISYADVNKDYDLTPFCSVAGQYAVRFAETQAGSRVRCIGAKLVVDGVERPDYIEGSPTEVNMFFVNSPGGMTRCVVRLELALHTAGKAPDAGSGDVFIAERLP